MLSYRLGTVNDFHWGFKPTTFKSADPCYLVSRFTYSTQEAGQGGRGDHQRREHVFVLLPDVNQDWGNKQQMSSFTIVNDLMVFRFNILVLKA